MLRFDCTTIVSQLMEPLSSNVLGDKSGNIGKVDHRVSYWQYREKRHPRRVQFIHNCDQAQAGTALRSHSPISFPYRYPVLFIRFCGKTFAQEIAEHWSRTQERDLNI